MIKLDIYLPDAPVEAIEPLYKELVRLFESNDLDHNIQVGFEPQVSKPNFHFGQN